MEQEVSFRKMFSQWHVSVPLRGFWYSDKEAGISNRLWDDMFQSPYGDFGTLTDLMVVLIDLAMSQFQSPYGDFGTLTN